VSKALIQKFFKEIAAMTPDVDDSPDGTGQIQEQFMKFLAESPQYKNAVSGECTYNKMSDANLISFIADHPN